jgi:hypothetical protein
MTPQWYFAHNRQKQGPYSLEQLREFAASGGLRPTDMVLEEGTRQWMAASSLSGLFQDAITAEPPAPLPVPPAEPPPVPPMQQDIPDVLPVRSYGPPPIPDLRKDDVVGPTDFLIPTNVSPWAIGSCYLGLLGLILPFIGLILAVPAFIFGILALSKRNKRTTYGSVTGMIRAVIGLICSGLAILIWGGLLLSMALSSK